MNTNYNGMKRREKWYVTDGRYNYAECYSLEEADNKIKELVESDKECREFWMNRLGRIPDDVDIPDGYFVTQNRFD